MKTLQAYDHLLEIVSDWGKAKEANEAIATLLLAIANELATIHLIHCYQNLAQGPGQICKQAHCTQRETCPLGFEWGPGFTI
ncbi:MAG: hypothetical protein ACW99U_16515 [Candidatus Thorarchaeota archaeon]|jgi:hypothetical protein